MKVARKLLVTGGASLVIAGGVLALPLAQSAPVGAMATAPEALTKPLDNFTLKTEANASFEVQTEVDPGNHALWANVTNKTDKEVVPNITFNGEAPLYEDTNPLKPGESKKYPYYFTGNNFEVKIEVSGEGMETYTTSATVNIHEPVSFKVTESNDDVVIGTLTNNSSLVPQTVYTKSYNDAMNVEHLEPGESRTIAIDHSTTGEQTLAGVKIATANGYESSYSVELGIMPELPPLPEPRVE